MTHRKQLIRTAVLPLAAMAAAAVALAGVGGCASDQPGVPAEQFMEPGEVTEVSRLADQQIAAGARTDATLRPYHFNHAGGLNSLGRTKLDNMLDADDTDGAGELVVYVDVPAAAKGDEAGKKLSDARFDAVTQHLMSRGMTEAQFRLESGYNPNSSAFVVSATPQGDDAANAMPTTGDAGYGGGLQTK
jgi:hypothetical protein